MEDLLHKKLFDSGKYVVLLHSCLKGIPDYWNEYAPINHVYKLVKMCTPFQFCVETKSASLSWAIDFNSYKVSPSLEQSSSLLVREATKEEIQLYKLEGGPVKVTENILYLNSKSNVQ